jgi:hypothetical protein
MPSAAYRRWATTRTGLLNEIEQAHAAVGGTGPGRRYATQQINHAYVLLLAAEFQGFCRELHDECVDVVVGTVAPELQKMLRVSLRFARQLDRGNATPAALGADFGRFDTGFWPALMALDVRVAGWQRRLDELNRWRNAIAHNDFDPSRLAGTIPLRLAQVRRYRRTCHRLTRAFDTLLRDKLVTLIGRPPW